MLFGLHIAKLKTMACAAREFCATFSQEAPARVFAFVCGADYFSTKVELLTMATLNNKKHK
jgi:hypothetical protein